MASGLLLTPVFKLYGYNRQTQLNSLIVLIIVFFKTCFGWPGHFEVLLNIYKILGRILLFFFFFFFNRHCNLVGYGLLKYRWVFTAGRLLQSAVASGTSNPQLGGPVIRTFQLLPPGVPNVWNDASEPQQRKVELWARNCREFCRKWRLPRHFLVLLHAVNLPHGTDGFTSPLKEGALRIFSSEKSQRLRPGLNPANLGTKGQHAHP